MPDHLNVIALISGGKDSLFSLLHCLQNGHKVVALANLYPSADTDQLVNTGHGRDVGAQRSSLEAERPAIDLNSIDTESSDLNSFMYQTVGHSLIPLYSTVLQLPLYRQPISGTAIQQSQYYDSSASFQTLGTEKPLDETEDLVPLLTRVISAHPEANAVSTGAILSTYQRTRVESIALGLGLTPLSYLWQYPVLPPPPEQPAALPQTATPRPDSVTGLLQDMTSAGLDARIIKIASAGIPESLLFANVADARTQTRLTTGLAPFFGDSDELGLRGAVLGEGGEYETIALSGPRQVWKGGTIRIEETTNESYVEGGVHYIKLGKARVVPHQAATTNFDDQVIDTQSENIVAVPSLLDPRFGHIKQDLNNSLGQLATIVPSRLHSAIHYLPTISSSVGQAAQDIQSPNSHVLQSDFSPDGSRKQKHTDQGIVRSSCTVSTSTVTINNLTESSIRIYLEDKDAVSSSLALSEAATIASESTAAEQMDTIVTCLPEIFTHVCSAFKVSGLSTTKISSATILLNSISDFASVNPIYSRIYPRGLPNPPSRVTIAAPLPAGVQVSLSLTLDLCPAGRRQGLHVQGRSYWAPANIGPYSQAITVPLIAPAAQHGSDTEDDGLQEALTNNLKIVHIAGQIPLVPSSMDVFEGSFLDTAILGLQHLWRVGQERLVDIWPWGVAYLALPSGHETDSEDTQDIANRARTAHAVWLAVDLQPTHSPPNADADEDGESSDPDLDVWEGQNNRSLHPGFRTSQHHRPSMSAGRHLHPLPNPALLRPLNNTDTTKDTSSCLSPPFLAVHVTALPRLVTIEWWSQGLSLCTSTTRSNPTRYVRSFPWGSIAGLAITPPSPSKSTTFIALFIHDSHPDMPRSLQDIISLVSSNAAEGSAQLVSGTTFTMDDVLESELRSQTTVVPAYALWGSTGAVEEDGRRVLRELRTALLLRVDFDEGICQ